MIYGPATITKASGRVAATVTGPPYTSCRSGALGTDHPLRSVPCSAHSGIGSR